MTSSPPLFQTRGRLAVLLAVVTGLLAAAALLLAPGLARADSSSTLTVIGTSDVSDSGLIPNLVEPDFLSAYPNFQFKYIGTASLTAITEAENGSVGASVLIVHAPSLENQFVAGGYSYEPYGRAIWTNDFVLAGPTGDPAGVGANAGHNIAQAFVDIAEAGYNSGGTPRATFVSRGGAPGTTVSEHGIWALAYNDGMLPASSGVEVCTVPSSLGGGDTPIADNTTNFTDGGACPNNVLPGSTSTGAANAPSWYVSTGLTQGPNVVAANACTSGTGGNSTAYTISSGPNTCYVYSDRGTYDYELSGASPTGGADQVPNLSIVTRDNSASAPGGVDELENYFHAYIINPAKSPSPVNLTAAEDFVSYITSPALQSQLSGYLAHTSDPGGAPFVADASPAISATGLPSTLTGGEPVTVSGNVVNQEPGYAPVAGQTVTVDEIIGGVPVAVATGPTSTTGAYSIRFTPPSSGTYQVSTGLLSLIEPLGLTPVYGDELSPGASAATAVTLSGAASITRVTTAARALTAAGSILPIAPDATGRVTLLARPRTSNGSFRTIGSATLAKGLGTYAINGSLKGGNWTIEVAYADGTAFTPATTAMRNVTVPDREVKVTFSRTHVRSGRLVLQGKVGQAPATSSAQVRLLVATLGRVSSKSHATRQHFKVKRVTAAHLKRGRVTYTLRHTLKRGYRYVLQLQYVNRGQKTTYSAYKHLTVS